MYGALVFQSGSMYGALLRSGTVSGLRLTDMALRETSRLLYNLIFMAVIGFAFSQLLAQSHNFLQQMRSAEHEFQWVNSNSPFPTRVGRTLPSVSQVP